MRVSSIKTITNFLDSPKLINKLQKNLPAILTTGAAVLGVYDTIKQPKEKRKERGIKNLIILSSITAASLLGAKKLIKPAGITEAAKALTAKEILSETGRLSIMGAIPVATGIASGIVADKITKTSTPKTNANKVKEGVYQYLANIFLCNVGAAGALFGAEALIKKGIIRELTPLKKTGVILAGIVTTGVIAGSHIANFIGRKLFKEEKHDERKPEALDVVLHTDDIATAGILSGFKWIEPILPVMYLISGHRAGFGYRNNHTVQKDAVCINKNH